MRKVRFNCYKVTALAVVFAFALIQNVSVSPATIKPLNVTDVKIDSELRALDGFLDDWLKVFIQQRQFSQRNSLTNSEFDAIKANADGVKSRCSQFEGAIREIIKKLKAAGRWEGLDDEVLAKTTDEKLKADLREDGGLRHLLESAASQYCSRAGDEITGPIEGLRPKLKAQAQDLLFDRAGPNSGFRVVRASYNATTPMFVKPLRCIGATIRVAVHLVATGTTGPAGGNRGNRECFCLDRCPSGAAATTE